VGTDKDMRVMVPSQGCPFTVAFALLTPLLT